MGGECAERAAFATTGMLAAVLVLLVSAFPLPAAVADDAEETGEVELLKSDSRSTYIHRITLYDHWGVAIDPAADFPKPYSPRMTCAKCHPYGEIAHGWHFNALDPNVPPGRNGEPWIYVDEASGTVVPLSYRDWPGTFRPEDAGLTHWQLLKRFGRHIPGGSFGEPPDEMIEDSPESFRWIVSGKLEIDCLYCHCADNTHDPTEVARQIERENFRWAPTAAAGLGTILGDASKTPDEWDPELDWDLEPDPDYPDRSGPRLTYDKRRFDRDDRVVFNLTRRPPVERCYYCHSVRQVGDNAPETWETDRDVHIAAGMLCVDCHRNGIDHNITRGDEAEADPSVESARATLTCRGCHLGVEGASGTALLGGRLGAPRPLHRGLPAVHIDRLSCTTCHSGPWPEMDAKRFQTSFAHGLGLASRERRDDTPPEIVGPVFARDRDDDITPHRVYPATAKEGVRPFATPLAHDVRPATQSLGVGGCSDCHAHDTPLFAGKVRVGSVDKPMAEWFDFDTGMADGWAFGFLFRPFFKVFAFVCAGLIGLMLIRFACDVFHRCVFKAYPNLTTVVPLPAESKLTLREHAVHLIAMLGFVIQAGTGFGALLVFGEFGGWLLLIHMCGAGVFVFGLTLTGLQWARRCRLADTSPENTIDMSRRWLFWLTLACGLAVMTPMLLAMLPVFGTDGQHLLVTLHFAAAIMLTILLILHTIVSIRRRKT